MGPPTTSICLHTELLVVKVKSCDIKYKVSGDQFCGWSVTGINPVTSDVSVYILGFVFDEKTNSRLSTHLKDVVA